MFLIYIHLSFYFDLVENLFFPIKVVANRRKFVSEKSEKDEDLTSKRHYQNKQTGAYFKKHVLINFWAKLSTFLISNDYVKPAY